MLKCFQDFLIYIFVCLTEVLSSLRMSDDHILYACVNQHIRGNLSCESSLLLKVHVLSADLNVRSFACLYNRDNVNSRNAEQNINLIVLYKWFQGFN